MSFPSSICFVVENGSVLADLLAFALADRDAAAGEREVRDLLLYLVRERSVPLA